MRHNKTAEDLIDTNPIWMCGHRPRFWYKVIVREHAGYDAARRVSLSRERGHVFDTFTKAKSFYTRRSLYYNNRLIGLYRATPQSGVWDELPREVFRDGLRSLSRHQARAAAEATMIGGTLSVGGSIILEF